VKDQNLSSLDDSNCFAEKAMSHGHKTKPKLNAKIREKIFEEKI
jgi:hypothetical protein